MMGAPSIANLSHAPTRSDRSSFGSRGRIWPISGWPSSAKSVQARRGRPRARHRHLSGTSAAPDWNDSTSGTMYKAKRSTSAYLRRFWRPGTLQAFFLLKQFAVRRADHGMPLRRVPQCLCVSVSQCLCVSVYVCVCVCVSLCLCVFLRAYLRRFATAHDRSSFSSGTSPSAGRSTKSSDHLASPSPGPWPLAGGRPCARSPCCGPRRPTAATCAAARRTRRPSARRCPRRATRLEMSRSLVRLGSVCSRRPLSEVEPGRAWPA